MSENVIILGAGFSRAANIPLLSQFAQTMWDMCARKSYGGKPLSPSDCDVFDRAEKVRKLLDNYHGRASFDDRNIEDILSILSFNVLAGDDQAKEQVAAVNTAIARTIELTCTVAHSGLPKIGDSYHDESGSTNPLYVDFWRQLFKWYSAGNNLPSILTFNYDLVLERALFHALIGTALTSTDVNISRKNLRLSFHHELVPKQFFGIERRNFGQAGYAGVPGTVLVKSDAQASDSEVEIEILKLHGSVNFPSEILPKEFSYSPVTALQNPNILPPIFNKLSGSSPNEIWKTALLRLRNARNVVMVGYSLPKTDIYMQYFLKSALGPNVNFDKLTVYDPALFAQSKYGDKMRKRYESCFAPQLRSRIDFTPKTSNVYSTPEQFGTAQDFVSTLGSNARQIFF